uniref:Biotin carboxyl carrier protein of acetyl-CoA carboxylase n=1 Tax=Vertebrata lanosa TaxID=1261582 RepID=A0A0B5VUS2_9FLOR|nr:biotin carboxyl carrier protein of acetyl-CoA carboxylase [Vertebrata lanosa]AJH65938.1 biotin carboxyl carrier protein of acetyl-CoA carboxylase [Vertebrata lanosa]
MNKTQNIKKFIDSITKNNIDKITINKKKTKILVNKRKIHRGSSKAELQLHKKINNKTNKNIKPVENSTNILDKEKTNKLDNTNDKQKISTLYSTIVSPMVGTFYKSPAPNESTFIEIGDTIKPKQIVCIIEAMKLMNEIESEIKGEVVEILVKDGDIVDCGQSLIKVKIK